MNNREKVGQFCILIRMVRYLIDRVIDREGGFVWHPDDRGGATKYGITQKMLGRWRKLGRLATPAEVEVLSRDEAAEIYLQCYWLEPGLNKLMLHPKLTELVFDAGVHHGPGRAKRLLQKAVGVKVDGIIGPKTQSKLWAMSDREIGMAFMGERIAYLGLIITRRPSQAVFAHGWMRRMQELLRMVPN